MNITATCVSCGQKLSAPASLAGRRVPCPKCKAPVDVPAAVSTMPQPAASSGPKAAPPPLPGQNSDVSPLTLEPQPTNGGQIELGSGISRHKQKSRRWMVAIAGIACGVVIAAAVGVPIWLKAAKAKLAESQLTMSLNNLRMMSLGFASAESRSQAFTFPPAAIYSPEGKPLLSWRVAILPFLEEKALYEQFHKDEPWDSPHNAALISKMPSIYEVPGLESVEPGKTSYLVPVAESAAFFGNRGRKQWAFVGGLGKTIFIVEAAPDRAVV